MENKQLCLSFSREACMPPEICTVKNGCTYSPLIRCNQTACSKGVFFKHFEVYTLFFNKAMVNIHHCPMGLLIAPIQRLQKLKSSPWTSSTPSSQINISTCRSKPLCCFARLHVLFTDPPPGFHHRPQEQSFSSIHIT